MVVRPHLRAASRALIGWLLAASGAAGAELAKELPDGVPSLASMKGWEKIAGEAADARNTFFYEFYVNPERQAIYQLTRYRVAARHPEGGPAGPLGNEMLLWNPRPGTGELILCYEKVGDAWRRMEPATPEYRSEMLRAIQIYGLHRDQQARNPSR